MSNNIQDDILLPKQKNNRRKYWKFFLGIICAALFFVPFSETCCFFQEGYEKGWKTNYAYNTLEYFIGSISVVILLILIPRVKNITLKKFSILILLFISGVAFLFALQSIILPIQDFIPYPGVLLLIILFPIVAIDSGIEWRGKLSEADEI